MLRSRNAAATYERPPPVHGFEDIACNWDHALGAWSAKILPGEFYITRAEEAITTVLGSCISACIRDPELAVGLATRYGSFAMESLINGLLKLGARRERLEVKLFGGGHILNVGMDVGDRNIDFARHWLKVEGYKVVAEDVGETVPRRVVYFPASGKVRVKHLRPLESREIAQREQQYLRKTAKPAAGEIELF